MVVGAPKATQGTIEAALQVVFESWFSPFCKHQSQVLAEGVVEVLIHNQIFIEEVIFFIFMIIKFSEYNKFIYCRRDILVKDYCCVCLI